MTLMQFVNKDWSDILLLANQNINQLMIPDVIK